MKKLLLLCFLVIPAVLPLQSFLEQPSNQGIEADTICLSRDILPIFNSNCAQAGCHDATTHRDGVVTTTYDLVMKGIRAGNPNTSSFYRQINQKTMPQFPYLPIPDSLKNRIAAWITAGAKNNACADLPCDTTNIDYLRDIKPILQVNCVGCHQSSLAGGGVHLDNDENNDLLKETIYATVAHLEGAKAMPVNIAALSKCQVAKIRNWAFPASTSGVDDQQNAQPRIQVIPSVSGNDVLRFSLLQPAYVTISVFAADGSQISQQSNVLAHSGANDQQLGTAQLPHGLYFVRLVADGRVVSQKFVR